MRKSLRLFSCAVLGAAILAPTVVGNNHAQADSYYGRGYYNNYYPNYGYNYGYNGYYPGYNYNYGYNYGYNNYYPNYNYGYNYGYNNYNPGYNNYNETGTYRYSNGYLYYILSDGSYYVNYNGRWVRGGDYITTIVVLTIHQRQVMRFWEMTLTTVMKMVLTIIWKIMAIITIIQMVSKYF